MDDHLDDQHLDGLFLTITVGPRQSRGFTTHLKDTHPETACVTRLDFTWDVVSRGSIGLCAKYLHGRCSRTFSCVRRYRHACWYKFEVSQWYVMANSHRSLLVEASELQSMCTDFEHYSHTVVALAIYSFPPNAQSVFLANLCSLVLAP